jgi:NADH-quinone oxidoreductase subunit C
MHHLEDLGKEFSQRFGGAVEILEPFRAETSWRVSADKLVEVMAALKETGFDYLVDISTVDHFDSDPRFEAVYELFSYQSKIHLRIKVWIPNEEDLETPSIPSVIDIWPTANWHEREAFDMMGIRFDGHPDLRRILMWEGYPFYPLRKDFPLEGKPTEMPDIAFTKPAPLEGGPFVTSSESNSRDREPRAKIFPPEPSAS